MRNTTEIMEYLNVGQNRTVWEGKTLDKALELEKQYEREISEGTIGYALICDFDCSPFILEDEDKAEMIEKERFKETGLVLYEIKNKEEIFKQRVRQRNLPLKFEPYSKIVSLHYPDNVEYSNLLEYCGTHWENLLTYFFRSQDCVLDTNTNNGMTSQAIEISFKYDTSDETIEVICNQAIQFILDATKPKFTKGTVALFTTSQTDLMQYDNKEVTIQRVLSEDECDIDEVGYMYEVMDLNGNKFQAYQNELF